ncbi:hypothetical protein [Streptomyces sp. NPDC055189]
MYEGLVERTPPEPPKPADEVRGERLGRQAMELLRETDSLRIGVEMTTSKGSKDVSVHMDRRNNCTATFDSGPMEKGEMIVVGGGAAYLRFSDESLDAIRATAAARGPEFAARVRERTALVRGKYMKVPEGSGRSGSGTAQLTKMCDLDGMLGQVAGSPGSGLDMGGVRALPDKRWHGEQVTPLAEDGEEMVAYLATGGKPYMVGAAQTRGDERMEMRMSDYGKPVTARTPDPSLVLDIEELGWDGGGNLFEV